MSFYGKQRIPKLATIPYIYMTVVFAMGLTLLLSPWHLYLPSWLAWVVAWWSVRNPKIMSMGFALVLGACFDVIRNQVFGATMLEFLLISYVMGSLRYRFEMFPFLMQTVLMTVGFVLIHALIIILIAIINNQSISFVSLISPALNGILWTPFTMLMVYPLYRPIKDELNTHQSI